MPDNEAITFGERPRYNRARDTSWIGWRDQSFDRIKKLKHRHQDGRNKPILSRCDQFKVREVKKKVPVFWQRWL
jgi:hypothetical protein